MYRRVKAGTLATDGNDNAGVRPGKEHYPHAASDVTIEDGSPLTLVAL